MASASCVVATPVTPAPATPAQATAIQTHLLGHWNAVAVRNAKGAEEEFSGGTVEYTFVADGKFLLEIRTSLVDLDQVHSWHIDGRNIHTSYSFIADGRIDKVDAKRLELFNYGNSETWVMERVP